MKTQTTQKYPVTHTSGPWNVGDDSPNDYEGPIIDTRDRAVAVITIDHETESTPEDRANARLIAAAPELLEALRVFVSCAYPVSTEIDERGYRWTNAYLDQALPIAHAAIAKADGKP